MFAPTATSAARASEGGRSSGAPPASLHAAFAPNRLGAPAAITFILDIDPPTLSAPPPLAGIDFSYPPGLGFATSGLGLAACDPAHLETEGAPACPANSKIGSGRATVQVAFGPDLVAERVALALFTGPSPDGFLHILILATGREPIDARIVMTGVLRPGHLNITVPAVPGLPGGPDVSLAQIQATLGGALTYHETVHGKVISYRPKGIGLPASCPRGGWRVGATLAFTGGGQSHAGDAVRCPPHRRRA
jgi:hypothetical protein